MEPGVYAMAFINMSLWKHMLEWVYAYISREIIYSFNKIFNKFTVIPKLNTLKGYTICFLFPYLIDGIW